MQVEVNKHDVVFENTKLVKKSLVSSSVVDYPRFYEESMRCRDAAEQTIHDTGAFAVIYSIHYFSGIVPRILERCEFFSLPVTEDEYLAVCTQFDPYGRDVVFQSVFKNTL